MLLIFIICIFVVLPLQSSSLPRPYIGSHRNRHYIYNKLPPTPLLPNDYFFSSSKSFLANQSKPRIYVANEVPTESFHDRVEKEFISTPPPPPPLADRQLYSGHKARDFLSSPSSSLFLLPTTQNKTSRLCHEPYSLSFVKEQQQAPSSQSYESHCSYNQARDSGNKSHSYQQPPYSTKQYSIDNYRIDRNNPSADRNSFSSSRLLNDSIVVNKDNGRQFYPSFTTHPPKTADSIFSLSSSNKSTDSKPVSKIANHTFDRPSSFRFSADPSYRPDCWKATLSSTSRHRINSDMSAGPVTHSYDQRISDQGNKYVIQLTTDDFDDSDFIITPYYSRHQLVIDAKHNEEDSFGGFIRRELHKIFAIPKHIDLTKHSYSYNKKTREFTIEMPYLPSTTTTESTFIPSAREPAQSSAFSYADFNPVSGRGTSSGMNTTKVDSPRTCTSVAVTSNSDSSMSKIKPFDFDGFHRSAFRPQIIPGSSNENGSEKKLLMSLELVDYQPEDIQVSIKDRELIVKAERKIETDTRKSRTSFFQSTSLPPQTDIDRLQSNYTDGKLVIEAPYLERSMKANHHAESHG